MVIGPLQRWKEAVRTASSSEWIVAQLVENRALMRSGDSVHTHRLRIELLNRSL